MNNGAPELVEVVREPLEPGVVVVGRDPRPERACAARSPASSSCTSSRRRASASGSPTTASVSASSSSKGSPTSASSRTRSASAPRKCSRSRSTRQCSTGSSSRIERARTEPPSAGSSSWSRTGKSSIATCKRVERRASRSSASTSRRSRSSARSPHRATGSREGGALVAVAVGHDRTTIAVSTGQHCEFTRVLDWGGWSLNVALARELDMAPSEVESIKRQLSFAEEVAVEGLVARAEREGTRRHPARPRRIRRASWSRRCTSTRLSRARSGSGRSSSPAAPRTCPVSPRR